MWRRHELEVVALGLILEAVVGSSTGSNLGDGVLLAALPLLAARLSRDPLAVSGVTVAVFLPWLLFSLPQASSSTVWIAERSCG